MKSFESREGYIDAWPIYLQSREELKVALQQPAGILLFGLISSEEKYMELDSGGDCQHVANNGV